MLQETANRVTDSARFAPPLVVCNDEHRFIVAEQLREIGAEPRAIVLEPEGRNTAPAAAVAALMLAREDDDALVLLLPSGPHHRGREGISRRRRDRRAHRARRGPHHLRHDAANAGNRLRLHPAAATLWPRLPGAMPWRVSWKSRMPQPPRPCSPKAAGCGTAACSCSRRSPTWRNWTGCIRARSRPAARPSSAAARTWISSAWTPRPSRKPSPVHRLRGHGAHRARGGGAGRYRLEQTSGPGRRCGEIGEKDAQGNVTIGETVLGGLCAIPTCAPTDAC